VRSDGTSEHSRSVTWVGSGFRKRSRARCRMARFVPGLRPAPARRPPHRRGDGSGNGS
jgi:hypothetical protein